MNQENPPNIFSHLFSLLPCAGSMDQSHSNLNSTRKNKVLEYSSEDMNDLIITTNDEIVIRYSGRVYSRDIPLERIFILNVDFHLQKELLEIELIESLKNKDQQSVKKNLFLLETNSDNPLHYTNQNGLVSQRFIFKTNQFNIGLKLEFPITKLLKKNLPNFNQIQLFITPRIMYSNEENSIIEPNLNEQSSFAQPICFEGLISVVHMKKIDFLNPKSLQLYSAFNLPINELAESPEGNDQYLYEGVLQSNSMNSLAQKIFKFRFFSLTQTFYFGIYAQDQEFPLFYTQKLFSAESLSNNLISKWNFINEEIKSLSIKNLTTSTFFSPESSKLLNQYSIELIDKKGNVFLGEIYFKSFSGNQKSNQYKLHSTSFSNLFSNDSSFKPSISLNWLPLLNQYSPKINILSPPTLDAEIYKNSEPLPIKYEIHQQAFFYWNNQFTKGLVNSFQNYNYQIGLEVKLFVKTKLIEIGMNHDQKNLPIEYSFLKSYPKLIQWKNLNSTLDQKNKFLYYSDHCILLIHLRLDHTPMIQISDFTNLQCWTCKLKYQGFQIQNNEMIQHSQADTISILKEMLLQPSDYSLFQCFKYNFRQHLKTPYLYQKYKSIVLQNNGSLIVLWLIYYPEDLTAQIIYSIPNANIYYNMVKFKLFTSISNHQGKEFISVIDDTNYVYFKIFDGFNLPYLQEKSATIFDPKKNFSYQLTYKFYNNETQSSQTTTIEDTFSPFLNHL